MPKKVLFIIGAFPPSLEVGGFRIARFCKYLSDSGWEPEVLTETSGPMTDDSFPLDPRIKVHRVPKGRSLPGLYQSFRKSKDTSAAAGAAKSAPASDTARSSLNSGLRQQVLDLFSMPDLYASWRAPALRYARTLLRQGQYDAIVSSSPPMTAHLIAGSLAREFGAPWISDYRDPWAQNPVRQDKPFWYRWQDRRWESACIADSDFVICNTEPMRRLFVAQYPDKAAERFITITNGYDDTVQIKNAPTAGVRTILHLGSIYGSRGDSLFFQVLHRLATEGALANVRVLLTGKIDASFVEQLQQDCPGLVGTALLEIRPPVAWREAQELLTAASVLLVIQGGYHLQVPAKFFDYLPTGKPILAVAAPGALSELVEATHSGIVANPDDPVDLRQKLLEVLNLPTADKDRRRDLDGEFHFRSLTRKLDDVLQRAIKGRRG
ncbi:MAG: glycosyltransferase [Acidobacteriales bacterium]|nr:glycosyltransferase [Terriglobales bacterium]